MTYTVSSGTLNPTQLNSTLAGAHSKLLLMLLSVTCNSTGLLSVAVVMLYLGLMLMVIVGCCSCCSPYNGGTLSTDTHSSTVVVVEHSSSGWCISWTCWHKCFSSSSLQLCLCLLVHAVCFWMKFNRLVDCLCYRVGFASFQKCSCSPWRVSIEYLY